jgi:hypothetical protein
MNEQFERLMARVESLVTRIESVLPQRCRRRLEQLDCVSLSQAFVGPRHARACDRRDAAR